MILRTLGTSSVALVATAAIAIFVSQPVHALTFNFSLTSVACANCAPPTIAGTVTGHVDGLVDNAANQAATNVFIDSYPAAILGIGTLPFDVQAVHEAGNYANGFTVANGVITSFIYSSAFNNSLTRLILNPTFSELFYIADTNTGARVTVLGDVSFSSTVSEVPLPAALPLFATGLGMLGFAGWRRKRKAALAAA